VSDNKLVGVIISCFALASILSFVAAGLWISGHGSSPAEKLYVFQKPRVTTAPKFIESCEFRSNHKNLTSSTLKVGDVVVIRCTYLALVKQPKVAS
jgi:hypothetical protein